MSQIEAPRIDPEKVKAIQTTEGPLLIIAGPGSGKTMTLVERTVELIRQGVAPEAILVATFTEKAAAELTTRISNRLLELDLKVNLNEMWIGTLHSLFLRILEEHREFTRLKSNYRILDQFDQRYFIYSHIREFQQAPFASKLLNLQYTNGWTQADRVSAYVNKVSEELLDVKALKADDDQAVAAIGHFYEVYENLLEEDNCLDFATIQVEAFHLIDRHPEVLESIQDQIRYLMIDEYQDTNTIQEKILLKLAERHGNLCVVGDDDQGLYRFRGATVRNILEFSDNFETGRCQTVKLTTNYRSHPEIISFYNRWMEQLDWSGENDTEFRFHKDIKPREGEFPETASVVRIYNGGTTEDYHQEVLEFIQHLLKSGKLDDFNQIGFLFRSVKSDRATALAQFLEENGVPVFAPRSALFFDREEIRLVLGALIFIFPNLFDLLKWSDQARLDVWDFYHTCKVTFANAIRADQKKHAGLLKWANEKARNHLRLSKETDYRLSHLVYELMQFPLFRGYLEVDLNGRSHDLRASYNLALLSQLVTKFEYLHNIIVFTPTSLQKDLQAFFNRYLRFLIDGGIEEYEGFEEVTPTGCVSFMTIHQSKGLEFPIVLVGSMEASPRKQYDDIDEALQNRYYHKKPFEPLDRTKFFDFWRLFYTAFSRPQNLLGLICHEEYNKNGSLRIPRKEFHGPYQAACNWRSEGLDVSQIDFEAIKEPNIKHQYSFTSHILLYENCPLQYKFFKELEFAAVRQSGPMAGTLIHQTIEDIHKAVLRKDFESVNDSQIQLWFNSNYRTLSRAERTYLAPAQLKSLLDQILTYKRRHEHDWAAIQAAEVDVSLVKEDYILHGTIDLIRGSDDTVEIVDFKSGKKPDINSLEDRRVLDRYRRQLEIYAHLVEERTDHKVSRMHLYYTAEKDGVPMISYDRDRANIGKTISTFDEIVLKIEAKNYDMSNTVKTEQLCGNCDMRHHCNPSYV